ncbi:MAG: hypothetical protein ABI655_04425 [Phenylobacterium sp.]
MGEDEQRHGARDQWFRRSAEEVELERRQAEAAGRELWDQATRTGQPLLARTQAELEALGRTHIAQQALGRARAVGNPETWREAAMQANAGVRAAADVFTLGKADELAAGAEALIGHGGPGDFRQRYQANLNREHEGDSYDATHRAIARTMGATVAEALLYKGGARAGAKAAGNLSPAAKGRLGEGMSQVKTALQLDRPIEIRIARKLEGGGYTYPDQVTRKGRIVEAKFGPRARLSPRQRQAQQEFGPRYRVDHWQPHHVGRGAGAAAAGAGVAGQAFDDEP